MEPGVIAGEGHMRRQRVCAPPGMHISGSDRLRWWELPLESEEGKQLPSPKAKIEARARVDCYLHSRKSGQRSKDGADVETVARKTWNDEYARLCTYFENAYEGEGITHDDSDLYDGEHSVGQILEPCDSHLGVRSTQKKSRETSRQATCSGDGSTIHVGAADGGRGASGGVIHGGPGMGTQARRGQVRGARQLSHPFSTLRATSSVGTWWPVNTHAKPAWGTSIYGQQGLQGSLSPRPPPSLTPSVRV